MDIRLFFKKAKSKISLFAFPLIPTSWSTTPPNNIDVVDTMVSKVVGIALNLAGFAALIFIFIGGIQLITSNGDPSALEKGKRTLIYSLAGFILVIVSGSLIRIIVNLLT